MLFVIAAVITTNFQADFVILTCNFYMVLKHNSIIFRPTFYDCWPTDNIQADFAILTVIAAWSTDRIQADFIMLFVVAAWSTDNIYHVSSI